MDKEREPKTDSGYSEKRLDLGVDKAGKQSQVKKGGNIFDSKKVKKTNNSD